LHSRLRHLLLGPPLPSKQIAHEQLNKLRALAALSPDALSSIAYANQEIYLGLLVAGSAGLSLAWPIGIAIVALLVTVALSYAQTVQGYPSGGGAYAVARENLGTLAGLVAAASLLIGYLLTAAVSLTAGVEAIASAFPVLWPHRIFLSLLLLGVITLLNLRGMRESGTAMAVPVYLFLLAYLPMLAYGGVRLLVAGTADLNEVAPPASQPVTAFLVLRTFAAGCTALTGIETVSNAVPAFRPPQVRNARLTLLAMSVLMGLLFVGSIGLTQGLGVVASADETILSALAARLLGRGPLYLLIQFSTMLILAVAANTSFVGFPRVAALLARDGFLPRQLSGLGDRLVFANGILLLGFATAVLIVVFGADTHALIPLFAIGVFVGFTLSQAGMVVRWWRTRGSVWYLKLAANSLGALATGVAVLIIGVSKFAEGAWATIVLIPLVVVGLTRVREHYRTLAEQLSCPDVPLCHAPRPRPRVVVAISGVHRAVVPADQYALSISDCVTAVYVELEEGSGEALRRKWQRWWPDVPLVVLPSPYRSIVGPLLEFLDEEDKRHNDGQLATLVLPEFVPAKWWHGLLHNQTARLIKNALLYRRHALGRERVIIDVPYHVAK
jgi:amino acid transporter